MTFAERIPGDPDGYRPVAVDVEGADLACGAVCALRDNPELCGGAACLPGCRRGCGHVYYLKEDGYPDPGGPRD